MIKIIRVTLPYLGTWNMTAGLGAKIDWQAAVQMVPLLATLPQSARQGCSLRRLEVEQAVFAIGDKPHAIYCVISGEVRLLRCSSTGGEIILQRANQGFFAEASLDQTAYHCDAIAAHPSTIMAIPRRAFVDALEDATFRQQWFALLARELRRLRSHCERLSLRTARERITHFIEAEGGGDGIVLTQTKKDLAAELGLTHEALYRALAALRRDGKLVVEGHALRLLRHVD